MTHDGLHVLELHASNFLRLGVVALAPGDGSVVLSGPNGEGKSSVLSAIEAAIGGAKADPLQPIHTGHSAATIGVVLGRDGRPAYKVTKEYRANAAPRLVVTNAEGARHSSPQSILAGFYNALCFDPMEFCAPPGAKTPTAVAKAQRDILLRACPVDVNLDAIATERDRLYGSRETEGRLLKDAEGALATLPTPAAEVPAEVSLGDLLAARTAAATEAAEIKAATNAYNHNRETITSLQREIVELEATNAKLAIIAQQAMPDVAALDAQIAAAETTNAKARTAKQQREVLAACQKVVTMRRVERQKLSDAIEALDRRRTEALARATFPLPDMTLDEAGVLLHGVPFAQASTAEQVRASFGVLAALNPTLKVALIREGNSLDARNLALLRETAAQHDMQLWIERVAEDQAGAVVLEDGEIARVVEDKP